MDKAKEIRWFFKKSNTHSQEWFGENYIDLEPDFISEILGDTELLSKLSKGYAVFLANLYNLT